MTATRQLRVRYFASLREQARMSEETIRTTAETPATLWEDLRQRHCFAADLDALRVAVNEEFAPATQPLRDGDTVAFIPPVAGG